MKYYGNYLGLCVNNDDPEKRGRVQVLIPHIMPSLFEDWNEAEEDIKILGVGDNIPNSIDSKTLEKLMKILPWAESALPIIGTCAPGNLVTGAGGGNFYNESPIPDVNLEGNLGDALEPAKVGLFSGELQKGGNPIIYPLWDTLKNKYPNIKDYGIWGDASHQKRKSDHNTGDAIDIGINDVSEGRNIFNDLINSNSSGQFSGYIKYIIFNGQIWSPSKGLRPYTGSNPHSGHVHVSVNRSSVTPDIQTENQLFSNSSLNNYERTSTGGHLPAASPLQSNIPTGQDPNAFNYGSAADPRVVGTVGSGGGNNAIPSNIDSNALQALNEVGQRYGINPNAIASVINTESRWNTQARSPSGTYRGLTQIGQQTFNEAGGTLGGLTWNQYLNASAADQIRAYGDWLGVYNFSGKLQQNGINFNSLTVPQQAAFLQGFQFAPNGTSWQQAFAQGNYNVATTNSPQASFLGNTSIADMVRYYGGNVPGSNVPSNTPFQIPTGLVQNPDPHGTTTVLDMNNMAAGAFSYPAAGAMLWCFFREGNPLFPVYFAASYGQADWSSAYRYPVGQNGAEAGPGYKPSTADGNPVTSIGGVIKLGGVGAIRWEDTTVPDDATKDQKSLMIAGHDGSNIFFNEGYHQIFSQFDRRDQVDGDRWEVTMGQKEEWVQGTFNQVIMGDYIRIVGNAGPTAVAAAKKIRESLRKSYEPLNEPKNMCKDSGGGATKTFGSGTSTPIPISRPGDSNPNFGQISQTTDRTTAIAELDRLVQEANNNPNLSEERKEIITRQAELLKTRYSAG